MRILMTLLPAFILYSFFSCQHEEVLDKTISEKTISKALSILHADSTLTENTYLLKKIKHIADGWSVYRDSSYISGYKRIVDESKFEELKNELFSYFQKQNVTYRDIIYQKNILEDINQRFYERMSAHELKIKDECLRRQKEMDSLQKRLNNSVSFKITDLRTRYTPNNGNFVQFEVRYDNKTKDVIRATKVFVTIYDGFGNAVYESNIIGNEPFRNSLVRNLEFYENRPEHIDRYRRFERQSISGYKVEYDVIMINLGGEIIELPYLVNFNYKESDALINAGYCTYIGENEPLKREQLAIEREHENEKKKTVNHIYYLYDVIDKLTVNAD